MFIPHLLSKEYGESYEEFCEYELIKYCPYICNIENSYNNLTENGVIKTLWRDFQAELVCDKKTVPGTVSKMFQNKKI